VKVRARTTPLLVGAVTLTAAASEYQFPEASTQDVLTLKTLSEAV